MASARSAGASRSKPDSGALWAAASLFDVVALAGPPGRCALGRQLLHGPSPRIARPPPANSAPAKMVRTARTVGAFRRRHPTPPGVRDAPGGLLLQRQRELEPAGAVQQREQAGRVLPRAPRRCPSPQAAAHTSSPRARNAAYDLGRRPASWRASSACSRPLRLESMLVMPSEARRDPAVDGRGRQVHRAAVAAPPSASGESPGAGSPDGLQPGRRGRVCRRSSRPDETSTESAQERRGPRRRRAGGACSPSRGTGRTCCSSAATPPARGRPPTGRPPTRSPRLDFGAVTNLCDATWRHRRGRPAQLPGDLPARGPALQHPLDRVPRFVPGEPAVGSSPPPRNPFSLSGHAVLRSPGAGRSGPCFHMRMNGEVFG